MRIPVRQLAKPLGPIGLGAALVLGCTHPAAAWFHASHWGGLGAGHWSFSRSDGNWSASAFGHSASGTYGRSADGQHWATDAKGGEASAGNGSWSAEQNGHVSSGTYGTTINGTRYATGPNGAVAFNGGHYIAGGGTWTGFHQPVVVNQYGASCYNCGGWAGNGAAVAAGLGGLAVGTAIGAASANAASANAYAAGAAAGAAATAAAYGVGDVYATLPPGCAYHPVGATTYYACGPTWFTPYYGANGIYYRVVPPP
jgi:hypothetical protein